MNPTSIQLRVSHRFAASPQRVFDAWLDPAQVRLWLSAAAEKVGMGELIQVEIDPKVGGKFSFVYRLEGGTELHQTGEYLELDRPRRIVFTWEMALPDQERVIIDLACAGTGCELVLTHVMDPRWEGDISPAESAWSQVLEAIAHVTGEH